MTFGSMFHNCTNKQYFISKYDDEDDVNQGRKQYNKMSGGNLRGKGENFGGLSEEKQIQRLNGPFLKLFVDYLNLNLHFI